MVDSNGHKSVTFSSDPKKLPTFIPGFHIRLVFSWEHSLGKPFLGPKLVMDRLPETMKKLVLERTVQCSRTVRFFVMFDMFEVRFWAKM